MAKRLKRRYVVLSRVINDKNSQGGRYPGGKVVLGDWELWREHDDNAINFKDAVVFVTRRMLKMKIGAVIYVRQFIGRKATKDMAKLYQAKWGHDNKPFARYEMHPAVEYWRRKAGLPVSLISKKFW